MGKKIKEKRKLTGKKQRKRGKRREEDGQEEALEEERRDSRRPGPISSKRTFFQIKNQQLFSGPS
jgi:hypothetical protein